MKSFVALSILVLCAPSASAQTDDAKAPPAPVSSAAAPRDAPTGQLRVSGRVHIGETAPDFTAYSDHRSRGHALTAPRRLDPAASSPTTARTSAHCAPCTTRPPGTGRGPSASARTRPSACGPTPKASGCRSSCSPDDTGEISSIYGYYDLEQRATTPGFVVIDRRGAVRLALQGEVQPQSIVDLVRFTIVGEKSTSARTP